MKPKIIDKINRFFERKQFRIERKIFHLFFTGLFPLTIIHFFNFPDRFYIAIACLVVMSLVELIRRHRRLQKKIYSDWMKMGLLRKSEKNNLTGAFWIALGFTIIMPFPGKVIPSLAAISAGLADPMAEIFGRIFPYKPYLKGRKTLSGSLAFFLTSFILSLVYLNYFNPAIYNLGLAFLGSILATFIEAYSTKIKLDDNLTIIISTALLYTLLKGFGLI